MAQQESKVTSEMWVRGNEEKKVMMTYYDDEEFLLYKIRSFVDDYNSADKEYTDRFVIVKTDDDVRQFIVSCRIDYVIFEHSAMININWNGIEIDARE